MTLPDLPRLPKKKMQKVLDRMIKIHTMPLMSRYRGISLLSLSFLLLTAATFLTCRGEDEGTPPATPQNFTATLSPTPGQIILNWTREEGVSYTLFHSISAGMGIDGMNVMEILNVTPPYTHQGLMDGTKYYYRLTAMNSWGASAPTPEMAETTLPPLAPPAKPRDFTAVALNRQVTLAWIQQPSVTYYLFYSTASDIDAETGMNITGVLNATSPYAHMGLTNNTTYYYRLTAVNSAGAGELTDELLATPQANISVRGSHTCTVLGGRAQCWGNGGHGRLGDGAATQRNSPVEVMGLTSGVAQISAGNFHTCAVVEGRALCWGRGANGPLGHNREDPNEDRRTPTQVDGLTSRVAQISAGSFHTCAVVNGGALCWGLGDRGQLGHNEMGRPNAGKPSPNQVMGLTSGVAQISAGNFHTCAVVVGGALCWGFGAGGRLGHNERGRPNISKSSPTQVYGLTSGVTQISAGTSHTCAVVNGGAWCWGDGDNGRLGHNEMPDVNADSSSPTQVYGLTAGVTQISAGGSHTCAVVNGGAWCWGDGDNGRLGHNEMSDVNADSSSPTRVYGLTAGVTQISAGGSHTCAVVNGSAWCWGEGEFGRLGSGGTGSSSMPVAVSGL